MSTTEVSVQQQKTQMEALLDTVDNILQKADLPERHTFFQIEKFIIGKEPTAQSQLWAIVRELKARRETIESYRIDLQEAEDNLELFDLRIEMADRDMRRTSSESEDYDLIVQEKAINIRKLQRQKESLIRAARKVRRKLQDCLEETAYLEQGFQKILQQVGEMKPLDDEESQREMWNERLLEDFNLRVILQRPMDPEFVKTVLSLPDDTHVKKQMVHLINQIQNRMVAEKNVLSDRKAPAIVTKAKVQGK